MVDIVKIVPEHIRITEDPSATLSLTFDLYDRLNIGGAIADSDDNIMFTRDPSDQKQIIGFVIKVTNPDKEKVNSAITLGYRIVNYLCAMSGVVVKTKRPKIETQEGNKPQIPNLPKQRTFDLDVSKLPPLFSGDPLLTKRVDSYQSGMTALEDNDPEKAVPRLHQVIEKLAPKQSAYYQPLRDACSHVKLDNDDAVKALNRDFKITCTIQQPVDFTNPENWRQLYIHAHTLQQVADAELKKILP